MSLTVIGVPGISFFGVGIVMVYVFHVWSDSGRLT